MTRRQPWVVRCYRRAAWTIGDLSSEAADAFASLYADERRRGRMAAARLATRAFADLLRAGFIGNRPHPLATLGHDVRWAWRTMRSRPGVSVVVIISIGLAIGANTAAFSVVNAFLWRSWGSAATDGVNQSAAAILAAVGVGLAATFSTIVPAARAAGVDPVRAISGR